MTLAALHEELARLLEWLPRVQSGSEQEADLLDDIHAITLRMAAIRERQSLEMAERLTGLRWMAKQPTPLFGALQKLFG